MEEEKRSKGRKVTPEEKALWASAMEGVTPLTEKERETPKQDIKVPALPLPEAPAPLQPVIPIGQVDILADEDAMTLDRRQAKKIRQGKVNIGARIDLHGLTEEKAYNTLLHAVDSAFHRKKRCLLVITGKGKSGQGMLVQRVPEWLRTSPFKQKIIRVTRALPEHGGGGAWYVFLRSGGS